MNPEILNALLVLTTAFIGALTAWIGNTAKQRWNYDMDARAQATLHSALETGALFAWSKVTDRVTTPRMSEMIATVLGHVTGEGAGEAALRLNASSAVLRTLATAKLTEVGARLGKAATKD